MMTFGCARHARLVMVSCAALAVAACSGSGQYRVASVGNVPADTASADASSGEQLASNGSGGTSSSGGGATGGGTSGGSTGSSGTTGTGTSGSQGVGTALAGPVLVSAGNAVIGVAGKHNSLAGRVNGAVPGAAPVTGTVTAVLRKTGQTLVALGDGRSVVLNRAGGALGQLVAIDLGSRRVVSAPAGSSLLGVGVASATPPVGSLASANLASGGLSAVRGLPVGNTGGAGQAVQTVTGSVTQTVGAIVPATGLTAAGGLVAGGSATATTTSGSAGVGGLLGIGGLLKKKGH